MNKKIARVIAMILASFFVIGAVLFATKMVASAKDCNTCNAGKKTDEEEENRRKEEENRKKEEEYRERERQDRINKLIRQINLYIEKFKNKPGYYEAVEKLEKALNSYSPRTGYDEDALRAALNNFRYDESETVSNVIFTGNELNQFKPKANFTRAEFATILMRLDKQSTEGSGVWYERAMNYAKERGYLKGDEFGNMMPEKAISLAEVVAVMVRYKGYQEVPGDIYNLGNHWAKGYMQRAYTDQWINEIENPANLDRPVTRDEAAAIIFHAQGLKVDRNKVNENIARYRLFNDVQSNNPYFYYILTLSN